MNPEPAQIFAHSLPNAFWQDMTVPGDNPGQTPARKVRCAPPQRPSSKTGGPGRRKDRGHGLRALGDTGWSSVAQPGHLNSEIASATIVLKPTVQRYCHDDLPCQNHLQRSRVRGVWRLAQRENRRCPFTERLDRFGLSEKVETCEQANALTACKFGLGRAPAKEQAIQFSVAMKSWLSSCIRDVGKE